VRALHTSTDAKAQQYQCSSSIPANKAPKQPEKRMYSHARLMLQAANITPENKATTSTLGDDIQLPRFCHNRASIGRPPEKGDHAKNARNCWQNAHFDRVWRELLQLPDLRASTLICA
jgi:hypothetical protein